MEVAGGIGRGTGGIGIGIGRKADGGGARGGDTRRTGLDEDEIIFKTNPDLDAGVGAVGGWILAGGVLISNSVGSMSPSVGIESVA